MKSEQAIQIRESSFDEVRLAKRDAILKSLENGSNVSDACNAAGIDRRTYYNWIKADRDFELAVSEAKFSRIDTMQSVAYLCAKKSLMDPRYQTSLIAWMNNEGGWGKSAPISASQSNVHVYMPDNGRDARSMSEDEITAELKRLLWSMDKRALLELAGIPIEMLPESMLKLLDAHPVS